MDYNWKNKNGPNQGGNSWSNNKQYGQNQDASFPGSNYDNPNVAKPHNSYFYNIRKNSHKTQGTGYNNQANAQNRQGRHNNPGNSYNNQSNNYNNQGDSYSNQGNRYNNQGDSYSNQGNRYNNLGNSSKRSYNSFQSPNARTFNVQNNYDRNNFDNGNQRNFYSQQPHGGVDSYEMSPQFGDNQRSDLSDNNSWQSYDNNSGSYDTRHTLKNPGKSKKKTWTNSNRMFERMSKGQEKGTGEGRRLRQERKMLKHLEGNRPILVEAKKIIMIQLKTVAKISSTPAFSRLGLKLSQVVHDRLKIIAGDDKSPISENLLKEYRNMYPESLDERFVNAVKKRMDGEVADDEAELLSERDRVAMENTPLTFKVEAVQKQLPETRPDPQIRKKSLAQGTPAFQTRFALTVDDVDDAINIRAEQIKEFMSELDDDPSLDEVYQYVHRKVLEGGATLVKNQLARTLRKGLLRPDADEEYLMLRIFGQPKLPPQLCMEEFLGPYSIRELKKSFKDKHLLVARVKSRKDYEELLAKDGIVIAGSPIAIKKGEKMEINIHKYLRQNKTWIATVSKEEQRMSENIREQNLQARKDATEANKKRRLLIRQEKQDGSEGGVCFNDQKDVQGQENTGSQGHAEGHKDEEGPGDTEGQENIESGGNAEGEEDRECRGDMNKNENIDSQGDAMGQHDMVIDDQEYTEGPVNSEAQENMDDIPI